MLFLAVNVVSGLDLFNFLPTDKGCMFLTSDFLQNQLVGKILSRLPSQCQQFGSRSGLKFVGSDLGLKYLQMLTLSASGRHPDHYHFMFYQVGLVSILHVAPACN